MDFRPVATGDADDITLGDWLLSVAGLSSANLFLRNDRKRHRYNYHYDDHNPNDIDIDDRLTCTKHARPSICTTNIDRMDRRHLQSIKSTSSYDSSSSSTSKMATNLSRHRPGQQRDNFTTTTTTSSSSSTFLFTSSKSSDLIRLKRRIPQRQNTLNNRIISSIILSSCLLFVCIYNSVPLVSCARVSSSPLTSSSSSFGGRNDPGSSSSLMSLGSGPSSSSPSSSFSRRSEPAEVERDSNNIFGPLVSIDSDEYHNEMKCLFYNRTMCEQTKKGCGETFQVCAGQRSRPNENGNGNERTSLCYALWRNTTESGVAVEFKGCWLGLSKDCVTMEHMDQDKADGKQCMTQSSNRPNKTFYFCCCVGEMCNRNVRHVPSTADRVTTSTDSASIHGANSNENIQFSNPIALYFLLGLGLLFLFCVFAFFLLMFRKYSHKPNMADMPTNEPLLDSHSGGAIGYDGMKPINLKEIVAEGKFGIVRRATDGRDNTIAVKEFNLNDRSSWQIENDVYNLPQMKHQNILKYLGAEKVGESFDTKFWLITEYHPNGSLWNYLKSHTVNLNQLLTIIQGIGAGLTHLHEELPASLNELAKPSVAHRDFKSKNVLLGTNFRPCIADFGLAIVFHPKTICGDAHGQVGTRRYMAPEVLEGAINFNRDSFLRIDMYACGLVLWELMSRCTFDGEHPIGEYRLPFEDEVGAHPSLEDMQAVVSQQKKRPILLDSWMKHPAMSVIANTVQECWDQDAEARISASTICERIESLINA